MTSDAAKIDVDWELVKANKRYMDVMAEINKLDAKLQGLNARISRLYAEVKALKEGGEEAPEEEERETPVDHRERVRTELDFIKKYDELKDRI